ncbi:hypothetical protein MPH_06577 [Macrophomina phaseolina MS6]|uniref:alpha-amylase n=2 Tax=Macrophomina phaseolina TaxID=35725 RepID=K2SH25_MACPH|nr:hypothetical protein MPH_06577 [Macrophomina phaseolina MS6]KAH7050980.1 glycoside hydrolase superfamily [Macrophomina phaseolina]
MSFSTKSLVFLSLLAPAAWSATTNDWRSRSIYQVIVDRFARTDGSTTEPCDVEKKLHCGGTWKGLENKLDYIQGMGFTAIWISPVTKGLEGTWDVGENYHGFWQQDPGKLNEYFGTEDDLKSLSKAVHDRGMYLMIDYVANNLAWPGPGNEVQYSNFSEPFNTESAFHKFCYITDYSNPDNYQNCWLGNDQLSLPDINTEDADIVKYFEDWGTRMINDYQVDGFRVDAVKHVPKPFWNDFESVVNTYTIGEDFTSQTEYICNYMINAVSAVLNYPLWYSIIDVFANDSVPTNQLAFAVDDLDKTCHDPTLMGVFTENHDVSRLHHLTDDMQHVRNAIVFALLSDGIPILYYGAEQAFSGGEDPGNREALWLSGYNTSAPLYQLVKKVNFARNAMVAGATYTYWSPYWTHKTRFIYAESDVVAIRKGYDKSVIAVITNQKAGGDDIGPFQIGDTNFHAQAQIVDVLTCNTKTTGDAGIFETTVKNAEPQVWIPTAYFNGTLKEICPNVEIKGDSNTSPPQTGGTGSSGTTSSLATPASAKSSSLALLSAIFLVILIL